MRLSRMIVVGFALSVLASCSRQAPPTDPQYVAQWLRSSLSFVRSERLGPPVASRISAYGSLALYEGFAADPASGLRSLAGQLNGIASLPAPPAEGVDGGIVAAAAEQVVLDSLFRDGFASTRRTIDSLARVQVEGRVAAGVDAARRDRSVAHGQALGAAILAWAATDGFFATRTRSWPPPDKLELWANTITVDQFVPLMLSGESDLVAPANPGVAMELERAGERFVFTNRPKNAAGTTLPTFNPVRPTEPYWGELRPFAIRDGDECRPPAPPAYSEREGSDFWKMGREFADSMQALTPEKKQVALFWADNPVATGTPGFHWISVVNQMIARRNLTAPQAAELFALTSVAIADAFIGCWKEKYRSMTVRPVAYMHRVFDPDYATVIPTPPFPEYTSGHSVQSAAAVEVLKALVGDTVAFSDSTQVDVGQPPRDFANFTAALHDVATSRIYAGVHYVPSVVDGMTQGVCIGTRVLERLRTRREGN
ncbi:MAG TPA: vanadium-dependent haloperoxidase [Gemmatimonadaceae bacterium]|nr:vanadium-dependent haloperoxidase [Gemmatimonadaceae bacterium]